MNMDSMSDMTMGGMHIDDDRPKNSMSSMSSSNMSMGGMSMGSMTMSSMSMVFFNSIKTTLYMSMWTPNNMGSYAATCIFLIFLATGHRFLFALKSRLEAYWSDLDVNQRLAVTSGKLPLSERIAMDPSSRKMVLSEMGVEEDVIVIQKRKLSTPWRLTVDPIRAILDTIIAAVGFFLMLAVMTMNIGYFISVLAGTFVGSLIAGRFTV
ncbi:hypothetical protein HI914_02790 [Erysiphe necator]|nr:hypothetical protein HI914_02790 [Erysiphe necator]